MRSSVSDADEAFPRAVRLELSLDWLLLDLVEDPDLLLAVVILVLSFEAPDLVDERVVLPVGVLGSAATALSLPDLPEPLAFLPWEEACFLLGRSSLPLGVELRFLGLVRLLEPPLDLVEEAILPVEDVFRDTAHDIRV